MDEMDPMYHVPIACARAIVYQTDVLRRRVDHQALSCVTQTQVPSLSYPAELPEGDIHPLVKFDREAGTLVITLKGEIFPHTTLLLHALTLTSLYALAHKTGLHVRVDVNMETYLIYVDASGELSERAIP